MSPARVCIRNADRPRAIPQRAGCLGAVPRAPGSHDDVNVAGRGPRPNKPRNHLILPKKLERAKGFEPSTPTLARLCSTPELHPHPRAAATHRRAAELCQKLPPIATATRAADAIKRQEASPLPGEGLAGGKPAARSILPSPANFRGNAGPQNILLFLKGLFTRCSAR